MVSITNNTSDSSIDNVLTVFNDVYPYGILSTCIIMISNIDLLLCAIKVVTSSASMRYVF